MASDPDPENQAEPPRDEEEHLRIPRLREEDTFEMDFSNVRFLPKFQRFQFGTSALFGATLVVCIVLSVALYMPSGIGVLILGFPLFFTPILISAIRRAPQRLSFSPNAQGALTLFVVGHSVVMFALSALLQAEWKGDKGLHWAYYLHDGLAGVAWWPLYFWGAWMMVLNAHAERSRRMMELGLLGVANNFLISLYYVIACIFLNFAGWSEEANMWVWAPLSATVSYGLFGIALVRRLRTYPKDVDAARWSDVWTFMGVWIVSTLMKISFAMRYYESLPDEAPQGCFVVTAASRGHRRFVGSWFDSERCRWVNRQLLVMWKFEDSLRSVAPRFHRVLRAIYNRVGPVIAHRIRYRWQADVVYAMLKPIEWVARIVCDETSQ